MAVSGTTATVSGTTAADGGTTVDIRPVATHPTRMGVSQICFTMSLEKVAGVHLRNAFDLFINLFYWVIRSTDKARLVSKNWSVIRCIDVTVWEKSKMTVQSRRAAIKSLGMSALALAFVKTGLCESAFPGHVNELSSWLNRVQQNAVQLGNREISSLQWQEAIDRIYERTPLTELKEYLRFDDLSRQIIETIPDNRDELFQTIRLQTPNVPHQKNGSEPRRELITKIAHVKKGQSIPPHGHSNMVSAFLCLSGEFEVRQFDRLDDRVEHLVVRSSLHEKSAGPGTWSSISDYRDNVHWLTAKTDDCFLFTCKMLSIEEGLPMKGRINIDLRDAKMLGNDTCLASKITAARSREIY